MRRAARPGVRLDLAAHALPELAGLDPRDRGLAYELIAGTLQRRLAIDAVLGACAGVDMRRVTAPLRDALRLTAYQLLYLDRVPAHAAVSDGVELAKRQGRKSAAFANAVLRSVASSGGTRLAELSAGGRSGALAVRFSHPSWLVDLWRAELGEEVALGLLASGNRPPERCVRANVLRTTTGDLQGALALEGVVSRPAADLPAALVVTAGPAVEGTAAFREGLFMPQSRGSQLAGTVAGGAEQRPRTVADLCAAPGAKTSQLAAELPGAVIVAVERDPDRADDLRANLARQGVTAVEVVVADVCRLGSEHDGRYDAVLLDAPCTGLGTLASRPDLRWRVRRGDVARMATAQRGLVARAADLVAPGGTLTYAVCTLTAAETVDVVASVLRRGGFVVDDLGGERPDYADPRAGGFLLTLPSRHGTSGFFIARLRREGRP